MSFIDQGAVKAGSALLEARYGFPRAARLKAAFASIATEYWTHAKIGRTFEARGLLVTGLSRVGKSTEIRSLIAESNKSKERLPSGKPAKIVSCVLDGKTTWKDLGYRTLDALGYSMTSGRLTQSAVWSRVTKQTEEQGVYPTTTKASTSSQSGRTRRAACGSTASRR